MAFHAGRIRYIQRRRGVSPLRKVVRNKKEHGQRFVGLPSPPIVVHDATGEGKTNPTLELFGLTNKIIK